MAVELRAVDIGRRREEIVTDVLGAVERARHGWTTVFTLQGLPVAVLGPPEPEPAVPVG
jgi:hypothetical protein